MSAPTLGFLRFPFGVRTSLTAPPARNFRPILSGSLLRHCSFRVPCSPPFADPFFSRFRQPCDLEDTHPGSPFSAGTRAHHFCPFPENVLFLTKYFFPCFLTRFSRPPLIYDAFDGTVSLSFFFSNRGPCIRAHHHAASLQIFPLLCSLQRLSSSTVSTPPIPLFPPQPGS